MRYIHSYPNKFRSGSSVVFKNILITLKDINLYYKIYILRK